MFSKLLNWLKQMGYKRLIQELDQLEPILAKKIREGQKAAGGISPDEFSKELVDSFQRFLCSKTGVDPKTIGL